MIIRLNKALRELNIGRQTAVGFLQKRAEGLGEVKDDLNFKLNDKQYAALVEAFKKDAAVKEKAEQLFKKPEKKKDRDNSKRRVDSGLELGGHQKYTPLGKIDLDSVGKRPVEIKSDASPEKKSTKPETAAVSQKVEAAAVKEEAANKKPEAKAEEPKAEAAKVEPKKVEAAKPEPAAQKQADAKPAEAKKPVAAPEKAAPEKAAAEKTVVKPSAPQPAPQAPRAKDAKPADKKPMPKQHQVIQKPNAVKVAEVTRPSKDAKKGTEIFRTKTETRIDDTPKVTVLGKIDLSTINSSTRPKKKSRAERQRERQRQQNGGNNANANNRGKRERINNNKVDINAAANQQTGNKNGNGKKKKNRNRDNKPAEVNDEDVARQVKETLARLTSKSQNKKGAKYRKEKREAVQEKLNAEARAEKKESKVLKLTEFVTVSELATMMNISVTQVISTLMSIGIMASINQRLDAETINMVAEEFGFKTEYVSAEVQEAVSEEEDDESELVSRAPIVTVMGHVDHGKTSLLDHIRNTNVIAGEAGGITQHIGAYRVDLNGQKITFLDTPGHAAFTSMRARGAQATDIAVLVVAADDGIMPQTIEAINHAKAAGVDIIVAINKMDKPGVTTDRIMQQLTEYDLIPEEWGGDTICVPVSAVTKMNIDKLLEAILLVAEMKELKANPNRAAKGIVIEARLDKNRGPIATLLVQNGTLHSGDIIVAGTSVGRVRVMVDDKGRKVNEAGPSVPVEIMGLAEAPQAGDAFDAVSDERLARELVEQRKQKQKEEQFKSFEKVTLENLFSSLKEGELKELNIIVKADVQGSVEAVKQSLEKLSNEEVRVKIIHGGVGAINESDVMLANASNAIIVGFNVRPDPVAAQNAERDGVDIRCYRIIYDCIDEIQAAIKGMLAPKFREVQQGRAEVRQIVKISSVGNIAGCYVLSGKVTRNSKIRVVRDGIVITEDEISSLRRFKDDVKEVAQNFECGIGLAKFNDIKEGDIFEAFTIEEYRD